MNKNNTYISLYHAAQFVLKNTSARVKEIVLEIKNKEQSRHFHDIATLKDELVQKLKRAISEQRAAAFSQTMAVENDLKGLLNENENENQTLNKTEFTENIRNESLVYSSINKINKPQQNQIDFVIDRNNFNKNDSESNSSEYKNKVYNITINFS